ncbi:MAG TPA: hypothetical protein VF725_00800 [Ktedonobacterales bacterium]
MPRVPARPALTLLGALLCLAACAPAATIHASATATATPAPAFATVTPTPPPVLVPPPATIPAGWAVLATPLFSLAYPPDWTVETQMENQDYVIMSPSNGPNVLVTSVANADIATYGTLYCQPASGGARPTTFAHLPMTFRRVGLAGAVREWVFVSARKTVYNLTSGDAMATAAIQSQDAAILSTFRPDDSTPWNCKGS